MTVARGFFEKLLLVDEVTYGTTPAVSPGDMVSLPFDNISLGSNENMLDPETINHAKRYEVEPAFGNISVEGSVTVPLDVTNIGYWLKLLMGAPTTSGVGPYTHTFEAANSTPSVSLECGFTDNDDYFIFSGCKINSFSMNIAVDTVLTADISLLGSAEETDTSTLDAAPVEETLNRFQAKSVVLKEGGVSVASCQEISLEISNELADDVYTLSSNGFRTELPETKFMVSGSAKFLFEDLSLYNKAINATETSIDIELTNGTNTLKFSMPEVKFPRQPLERNNMGPVYQNIPFKAYFQDDAGGVSLSVELVNDKSSYA